MSTSTCPMTSLIGLAERSHQMHLVVDATNWRAYCGKGIAEAWPCGDDVLAEQVTCKTCRKGVRV